MKLKRRCKCGCGNRANYGKKWIRGHNWYNHGLRYHKLYRVWLNMRIRCYNPNAPGYQYYGGRGIRVWIRWKGSFVSFYKWAMNNGWKEGLQIDRRDNDGNYHPDNCRFVTAKVNSNNKRKLQKNNKTGCPGIIFNKARNKYIAQPYINGKNTYLGYFNTIEESAEAVRQYKKK